MVRSCLWLRDACETSRQPPPELTDVVVVGAGFCGLSAALRLQRQGAATCVLDAGDLERKSSVRNAGMVCTGLSMGAVAGETILGQALWPIWQMTRHGTELLYSLQSSQTKRLGSFMLTKSAAGQKALEAEAAARARLSFPVHMRYRHEQKLPLGATAALWNPEDFGVNPYATWQRMAQMFVTAGGILCERTQVYDMSLVRGRVHLHTSAGEIVSDACFVATGETTTPSWVPRVCRDFLPLCIAMSAVYAPAIAWQKLGIVPGALYWDDLPFFHYFWVTPDGYFTFGGEALTFPAASASYRARVGEQAVAVLCTYFPQLAKLFTQTNGVKTYVWSGQIVVTPDGLPVAWRPTGKGFTYGLFGFSGHGLSCGTGMGEAMAEVMLGYTDAAAYHLLNRPYRRDVWFGALTRALRANALADVADVCYRKFSASRASFGRIQ
jgi:glycine/D-amino acid oxidase-like deaminating enzyme